MSTQDWPTVSVVVPVFNGAAVIGACLDSLLEQDYPRERVEIVVVDNRSTDSTATLLQGYGTRLRVVWEPRRGIPQARNAGVAAAGNAVIAFIDADCVATPDWLRELVRPLRADPGLAAVGGRILALPGANAIARYGEIIHDHHKAIEVFRPPYFITMNLALPRAVFDRIGLFDEALGRAEDCDLAFRLHLAGERLAYTPAARMHHHNETTLSGLFGEGWSHGYWQPPVHRKYRDSLLKGRRRLNGSDYRELAVLAGAALRRSLAQRCWPVNELCPLVFLAGKKAGNSAGSLRFGYLSL